MPGSETAIGAGAHYRSAGQRQARLLARLRSDLFLDAQALRDAMGVSIATIRRDLSELEARGLLTRTHGGATVVTQVMHDHATEIREVTRAEEKSRIAAAAAALVAQGDAVLIDSGTTALRVARLLAPDPSLTFVTNGTDVLAALVAGGARKVHLIGGEYLDINHSLGGPLAAQMVRGFQVDKAFLCVSAVDLRRGVICTTSPQIACVQQAMIDAARHTIVVADHSKFDRASLSVIAPLTRVHHIVTDRPARHDMAALGPDLRCKFILA